MRALVRGVVAALSISVVVAAPATVSASAADETPVQVDRLAGSNRYETAALVSAQFPEGADTVYLANGEDWAQGADAVAAGAAAGSGTVPPLVTDASGRPAPMLLTRATGLPSATRAALDEIQPTNVVIMGGPGVVQPVVDEELLAAGFEPIRVFGTNRYGTAAALALTFEPGFDTVYVASGQPLIPKPPYVPMMPDALTASARAGAEGAPVLLTTLTDLPRETREALEALDPPTITIVGGSGTVTDRVEYQLSQIAPVSRISGDTRYGTAAALFESSQPGAANAYLASGEYFADSLSVSALAASQGAPLLLARKNHVPTDSREVLISVSPEAVRLIGGPAMLEDALLDDVRDFLSTAPG